MITYEANKEAFDRVAKNHQNILKIIDYVSKKGCPMCKFKPTKWPEFEFHMLSTHGISKEFILSL